MAAATVYLSESNGAGEVVTDNISNCNFGGVDIPNLVPATHPIVRPNGGTAFQSFQKYWRIKCTDMGTALLLNNFKTWKSSGAYVAGERMLYDNNVSPYATPTTLPPSATFPVAEPASANIAIGGSLAGSITVAPTYSNYNKTGLQCNVSVVTPIGPVNQKTLIYQWDES